jgi:hypothetical protein
VSAGRNGGDHFVEAEPEFRGKLHVLSIHCPFPLNPEALAQNSFQDLAGATLGELAV